MCVCVCVCVRVLSVYLLSAISMKCNGFCSSQCVFATWSSLHSKLRVLVATVSHLALGGKVFKTLTAIMLFIIMLSTPLQEIKACIMLSIMCFMSWHLTK